MAELRKIGFVFEDFAAHCPAQQLMDRFLMGYPRDGEFHHPKILETSVYVASREVGFGLGRRTMDFKLQVKESVHAVAHDADAVIVVPSDTKVAVDPKLISSVLEAVRSGASVFCHGALAASAVDAQKLMSLAQEKKLQLLAGTATAVTWRLPEFELPRDSILAEALIVVQGNRLVAELQALNGILPILEQRKGGESGVVHVQSLAGDELWSAGDKGTWSWPMLGAALSRSDSPQGDPIVDGRTQDLVGLGLVRKLAKGPRGWLLEHKDELRTTILVLDGVTKDFTFAVRTKENQTFSAQLYCGTSPQEQHYSLLAGAIEDFFRTGKRPWIQDRDLLIAELMGKFSR